MENFNWTPTVLSNTGCQFRFLPLYAFDCAEAPDLSQTLWDDVENFGARHALLHGFSKELNEIREMAKQSPWEQWSDCAFAKKRATIKRFTLPNGRFYEVLGVELAIETTAPGDRFNECGFLFETKSVVNDKKKHAPQFSSVYHQVPDGTYYPPNGQVLGLNINIGELGFIASVKIRIGFRSRISSVGSLGAHLIIDIGNTRTSALLLKDEPTGSIDQVDSIRTSCSPVLLDVPTKSNAVTRSDLSNVDNGIVGSWIMLHQTEFDEETPSILQHRYITKTVKKMFGLSSETFNDVEELRVPNMFVRYSPVILGKEAAGYLADSAVTKLVEQGLQIQQSSPKRYFAERKKARLAWSMIPNPWEEVDKIKANKLRSNILYWMNENGEFVDPDEIEPVLRPMRDPTLPNYPRSATFVWMLVGILERAWDQCNRLTEASESFTPYMINDVIITYPSGWTRDEISIYKQRCEEAVKIFERTNFSTHGQIRLNMNVDEAVASQLPYVFSEIHKYDDNAVSWLKFAGKEREENNPTFRVMNFDIGGGTSDISVVEYGCIDDPQESIVDIQPKLLYRDGYSEAGDELMRQIIENIIFPAIENAEPRAGKAIQKYFTGKVANATEQSKRAKDLKLAIMPLAIRVMSELSSGSPSGCFRPETHGVVGKEVWCELYKHLNLPEIEENSWWAIELKYNVAEVNKIIRSFFENAFANAARIAAVHDIDMFFMSGKTSELPELMNLALEYIPITNDRIKTAKDYCAGDWYPFVKTDENGNIVDNTVKDAKSITAVGAALNFMLSKQLVRYWKMENTIFAAEFNSQWGFLNSFKMPNGKPFVFNENKETKITLDMYKVIARRMTPDTCPAAVYKLQPRNPDAPITNAKFEAVIRRGCDEETKAEFLELVSLVAEGKECVNQYELAVCHGDEIFWQDSGCVIS